MQIQLTTDAILEGPESFTVYLLDSLSGQWIVGNPRTVAITINDPYYVRGDKRLLHLARFRAHAMRCTQPPLLLLLAPCNGSSTEPSKEAWTAVCGRAALACSCSVRGQGLLCPAAAAAALACYLAPPRDTYMHPTPAMQWGRRPGCPGYLCSM
jgi:hypothetical protein